MSNILRINQTALSTQICICMNMCASSSSPSSSWGEWHAYSSHLLVLFPPMSANQKIVTDKLSASILLKHGSDWFKYPGFHSLCEESQENC